MEKITDYEVQMGPQGDGAFESPSITEDSAVIMAPVTSYESLPQVLTSIELLDLLGLSRVEFYRHNGFGQEGQIVDGRLIFTRDQALTALLAVQSLRAASPSTIVEEMNAHEDRVYEDEHSGDVLMLQDRISLPDLLRFLGISRAAFYKNGKLGTTGRRIDGQFTFTMEEALRAQEELQRTVLSRVRSAVIPEGYISKAELAGEGFSEESLKKVGGKIYSGGRVFYPKSEIDDLRAKLEAKETIQEDPAYITTKEAVRRLGISGASFYANFRSKLEGLRINGLTYFKVEDIERVLLEGENEKAARKVLKSEKSKGQRRPRGSRANPYGLVELTPRQVLLLEGQNPFLDIEMPRDIETPAVTHSNGYYESDKTPLVDFAREYFRILEPDQLAVVELTLGLADGVQRTVEEASEILSISLNLAKKLDQEGVMRLRAERTRQKALGFTESGIPENK